MSLILSASAEDGSVLALLCVRLSEVGEKEHFVHTSESSTSAGFILEIGGAYEGALSGPSSEMTRALFHERSPRDLNVSLYSINILMYRNVCKLLYSGTTLVCSEINSKRFQPGIHIHFLSKPGKYA